MKNFFTVLLLVFLISCDSKVENENQAVREMNFELDAKANQYQLHMKRQNNGKYKFSINLGYLGRWNKIQIEWYNSSGQIVGTVNRSRKKNKRVWIHSAPSSAVRCWAMISCETKGGKLKAFAEGFRNL